MLASSLAGMPATRPSSGVVFSGSLLPVSFDFTDPPVLSPGDVVRLSDSEARRAADASAPARPLADACAARQAPGALRPGDVARVVSALPGGGAARLQRLEVDRSLSWWYRPAALRRSHPAAAAGLADLDLVRLAPGFEQVTDAVRVRACC